MALYHFLGVKGLIAFPFVVLALVWMAKWVIKSLIKKFALSLFGMKARVLRGATVNVHSVKAIPEPPKSKDETDQDEDEAEEQPSPGSGAAGEDEEEKEATSSAPPVAVPIGKKEPRDYVELDVTITPRPEASHRVWEPTEFILSSEKIRSLADLEEKSIGDVHSVEVWDGAAFGPDHPGKYPGEQRLKIVFEVKPGSKLGWLCYYNEAIGQLELPVGTVEV